MTFRREDDRLGYALALALGFAAFLFYWPSLSSGFVYDAEIQILADSYIHTPAHFADLLTLRVLGQDVLDASRPAHLFLLMIDSLLWGRNPFGYHLTSNLFHALNVSLLFLLLSRLGAQVAPNQPARRVLLAAALGAILFAFHPTMTEAVSEPSDREDPLSTFFLLVGMTFAGHFPASTGRKSLLCGAGCIAALFLAAASKETGYAGPFLLALYGWLFRRLTPRKPWIALVVTAFVVVGAFGFACSALEPHVSKIFSAKPHYLGGSLTTVLGIQPRIWTLLLTNVAWPRHLSADYTPGNVAWISYLMAGGALVVFLGTQLFLAIKSRLALFGAFLFWIGLAPVSNFIPIFRPIADRFLYLPMAGLAATICAALLLLRGRFAFTSVGVVVLAFELSVAPLAWFRQAVFANPVSLWRDTIAKSPDSQTAADNLGWALSAAGDYDEALASFQLALNLTKGKNADALAGAAITLDKMHRPADAEAALRKAIENDPHYGQPQELVDDLVIPPAAAADLEKILPRILESPDNL